MVGVAQFLQQRQGVRSTPQPVAVVAGRALASDLLDHVCRFLDELALLWAAHCILRTPARAMAGSFVAALHDVPGQRWLALRRFTDHVRRHLDVVLVPQVEHAWHAFPVAVGKPGIGSQVGGHAGREVNLGEGTVGALSRLPAGLELHGNGNNEPRAARPELAWSHRSFACFGRGRRLRLGHCGQDRPPAAAMPARVMEDRRLLALVSDCALALVFDELLVLAAAFICVTLLNSYG